MIGPIRELKDDPWRTCDKGLCTHDLAKGVLCRDLLRSDGPYPTVRPHLLIPRVLGRSRVA